MPLKITFVTSNANKFSEALLILGKHVQLSQEALELEEIQSVELEKVARHKLMHAYAKLQQPLFCEDTGLHIAELNNFPGALIKHYLDRVGTEGIGHLHGGSPAYAKTVVGYHDGENIHFFTGIIHGIIAARPQGKGFGWSTIFIPHIEGRNNTKSFAEIPITLKNEISMRSQALKEMLDHITANKE